MDAKPETTPEGVYAPKPMTTDPYAVHRYLPERGELWGFYYGSGVMGAGIWFVVEGEIPGLDPSSVEGWGVLH